MPDKIDGIEPVVGDVLELRLWNVHPGAYVIDGKLFFKLRDGSTLSCECIAEPYASQIAELFAEEVKSVAMLYEQNVKLGQTIMRWQQLFASLLDAKQKHYEMNPANAAPPDRIEVVNIEKEEYERWRKVCKIIDDATYKE